MSAGGDMQRDRRWAPRRSVDLGADLTDSGGLLCAVRITDLSEEGCMIRIPPLQHLAREHLHFLKMSGLEALPAYVIWCANGRAGLAFSEPLRPTSVQSLVMKSLYARISRQVAQANGPDDTLPPLGPFPFGR